MPGINSHAIFCQVLCFPRRLGWEKCLYELIAPNSALTSPLRHFRISHGCLHNHLPWERGWQDRTELNNAESFRNNLLTTKSTTNTSRITGRIMVFIPSNANSSRHCRQLSVSPHPDGEEGLIKHPQPSQKSIHNHRVSSERDKKYRDTAVTYYCAQKSPLGALSASLSHF